MLYMRSFDPGSDSLSLEGFSGKLLCSEELGKDSDAQSV